MLQNESFSTNHALLINHYLAHYITFQGTSSLKAVSIFLFRGSFLH